MFEEFLSAILTVTRYGSIGMFIRVIAWLMIMMIGFPAYVITRFKV